MKLSSRLRALRLRQQRTLKDVSRQCGFTISLLSKIESGKTTPPLATLAKIAAALGVRLGDLLDEGSQTDTVLVPARTLQRTKPTRTDKGYAFHHLASGRADQLMQPFYFIAEKGRVKPGGLAHRGEEFVYVLSGRMRYRVGETTHTLGPGDSLYFNSEEEHDLEPLTAQVRYLAIFTERAAAPKSKK